MEEIQRYTPEYIEVRRAHYQKMAGQRNGLLYVAHAARGLYEEDIAAPVLAHFQDIMVSRGNHRARGAPEPPHLL